MNYKICVYAICKNEENFVDRWMDAVAEADMVVVTDTGSTDGTVEKLRKRGAVVYEERIVPWRFDRARNIAMDHIPEDADICVSNDLDEIFDAGWRKKLEAVWKPGSTRARYNFVWTPGAGGLPEKQFTMEKIHCRRGFRWVHPVHEILQYSGGVENSVWVPGLVLRHYPDNTKPRSQYLPLLELSVEEEPANDRAVFWLGREYMYYGKYDESIATLERYLKMPSALWNEERCAAMRFISKCHQMKGDLAAARNWLYKAVAECPFVREPYLQMARLGYMEGNWPLVLFMTCEGLKISTKTNSYLMEVDTWGYAFYDLAAIALYRLGLFKKSYDMAKTALEFEPENERLKNNIALIALKLPESEANDE